jgi:hypothetical protein
MASKITLRKMVLTLKKELGILVKMGRFLITSAKRKRNKNKPNNRRMKLSFRILVK